MLADSSEVIITYNGKDITRDLRPYLLSFTFTDNAKGKADDISLTLQDRSGEWLRDWLPAKGDTITASILTQKQSLPCGSFSVDQADYSFPPHTLSIKGVSADVKRTAVTERKTYVWEQTDIRSIAAEIASQNGLSLYFSGGGGSVERAEQVEQSDLEFLRELAGDFGLSVKLSKEKLIVYDTAAQENSDSQITLDISGKHILTCRFSSKSAKTYRRARLRYHDPVKDEDYDETAEDDSEEGSERVLEIHERAETASDAKRIATQRLIEANRKEITGSLTLTGDTRFAAGITVMLSGFGMFSGKHFVNKVTHKVDGSGFTTSLELAQPQEAKKAAHSRKAARKKTGGTAGEIFYEGERYYR